MAKIKHTQFSSVGEDIRKTLARIIARELSLDVGAIIGSWGDTMTEYEILTLLREIEDADSPLYHGDSN